MADEKENEEEQQEEPEKAPSGKKKAMLLVGGAVAVPALAFVLALMAVPGEKKIPKYLTGLVGPLTETKIQVNLGNQMERFFVFEHNVVYEAYEDTYYANRTSDPLYVAYLTDALIGLAASKSPDQVYELAYESAFREEIKGVVEPLLFPVHVGHGATPMEMDVESGLKPGQSSLLATFRGPFYEHVIRIDDDKREIQLDQGPVVKYEGDERDLVLYSEDEETVYVDVSEVVDGFRGEVQTGVMGRVLQILKKDTLIQ